jgi:tetratricopeptide (TPR) repeat protein
MRRHRTYRAVIAWLAVGGEYHPYRLLKDKAAVLELIGQWEQARQIYSRNVEIARQSCDDRVLVEAQTTLASMLAMQGGFAEAMALLHSSLAICQRLADQTGIGQVEFLIGTVHADQGDYGKHWRSRGRPETPGG